MVLGEALLWAEETRPVAILLKLGELRAIGEDEIVNFGAYLQDRLNTSKSAGQYPLSLEPHLRIK